MIKQAAAQEGLFDPRASFFSRYARGKHADTSWELCPSHVQNHQGMVGVWFLDRDFKFSGNLVPDIVTDKNVDASGAERIVHASVAKLLNPRQGSCEAELVPDLRFLGIRSTKCSSFQALSVPTGHGV